MRALELLYVGHGEGEDLAAVAERGVVVHRVGSVFECIARLKRTSAGTALIDLDSLGPHPEVAMNQLREAADGRPLLIAMTPEEWEHERARERFEQEEIVLRPCFPGELWRRVTRRALPAPEQSAARLRGDAERLRALYADTQRLNRFTNDLDTLADQIVEIVRARLGANRVTLFLKTREEGRLRLAESFGVEQDVKDNAVLELGRGIAGKIAERREVVHVQEAGRDGPSSGREYKETAYLIVPLVHGLDVVGVICATDRFEGGAFTDEDVVYTEALSDTAAQVLHNALQFRAAEELTLVDELTGLWNRRYFERNLQMEVQRATRYGHDVTVAMLDIDHFKQFNDTEGHQAGDLALKTVAQILRDSFRRTDSVCRWGGEEFAVIMPETSRAEGNGVQFVDRARNSIEQAALKFQDRAGRSRKLTISGGVATLPLQAQDWEELVKKADVALYQAKEAGRNKIVGY
ncbi:MAG: GGDEF domain-containing protein [Planctomycetota bacterium]|jgi:diguanylate cyclase (GGDEF)-like protein